MRFSVMLGLAACCALGGSTVGCGTRASSQALPRERHPLPPDTLTMSAAEIGHYGGQFSIPITAGPQTFNRLISSVNTTNDITNLMFAGLTEFDSETQTVYPQLAKSWERSADGLTWTWHLRHGATFSDGHPITSADVLFMFEAVYDSTLHPSMQDLLLVDGKPYQVSAPDSYTVVTRVARPSAAVPAVIGGLRIMPRHVLEPALRNGTFASAYGVDTPPAQIVASGPFRLEQYLPNEQVVLAPNPWWLGVDAKGQRLPYLDRLVFLIVPDQNTATAKFQAGEVDAIDNVKPEDYQSYIDGAGRGGYTLHDLGASLNSNFIWFNLNRAPTTRGTRKAGEPVAGAAYRWFSNRAFRQAFSMAIDRDALIRGPMFGDGYKNWSSPTVGSKPWGQHGLVGFDYDPAAAKAALDRLGWKDRNGDGVREDDLGHPIRFTIKTNGDNLVRKGMLTLIRDDLARVGIDVVPAMVDLNTLTTNLREDFNYEAMLLGLGSAVPPDPVMYANFLSSKGASHYWNVRQAHPATPAEARIDALDAELAESGDEAVRMRAWKEIVRTLNDECFVVWLPSQKIMVPIRNRFGNVHPTVVPHRVLWNIDRVFVKQPPA